MTFIKLKNVLTVPLSTIEYFERINFSPNVNDLLFVGAGSLSSDDEISREKMAKKIPSEEHSPFYLSGASVDMPDDGMDEDAFQVSTLHSSKWTWTSKYEHVFVFYHVWGENHFKVPGTLKNKMHQKSECIRDISKYLIDQTCNLAREHAQLLVLDSGKSDSVVKLLSWRSR